MYKSALKRDRRFKAFTYEKASWRKMLISQPPVNEPLFRIYVDEPSSPSPEPFSLTAAELPFRSPKGNYVELLSSSGLRMAEIMPQYGFGLELNKMRLLMIEFNANDRIKWVLTPRQELSARQLQLLMAREGK